MDNNYFSGAILSFAGLKIMQRMLNCGYSFSGLNNCCCSLCIEQQTSATVLWSPLNFAVPERVSMVLKKCVKNGQTKQSYVVFAKKIIVYFLYFFLILKQI